MIKSKALSFGVRKLVILLPFLVSLILAPTIAHAQNVGPSGLPLPRFASLGSSKINVRHGPGQKYDVAWIFVQNGLPVEIIQEFDAWRKIRDSEGAEGWVHKTLLSGRRTALVTPWHGNDADAQTILYARADDESPERAILKPNVLVTLDKCDKKWCEITGRFKPDENADKSENFKGFIAQSALWGVYQNEVLD
jgi:SH3-like domain-containing protein